MPPERKRSSSTVYEHKLHICSPFHLIISQYYLQSLERLKVTSEAAAGDAGDVSEIHGTADPAKLREQVIA